MRGTRKVHVLSFRECYLWARVVRIVVQEFVHNFLVLLDYVDVVRSKAHARCAYLARRHWCQQGESRCLNGEDAES